MAKPYYKVNGVNILGFLIDGGLKFEENDLDSEDSGRTMDGKMHRGRIAIKDKHSLSCRPLHLSESNTILQLISSYAISTVETNIHPKYGTFTARMYNSSRSAAIYRVDDDGEALWKDLAFTLIEE